MNIKIIAQSPICHGAFTEGADTGNILTFRRMPIFYSGNIVDLPVISGNAVRGTMRRIIAREFFEKFELRSIYENKIHDKLYAVLGNGGALGKDMSAGVDVNKLRELRSKFPALSVFGGACYKYILQGMFSCGFFKLDCTEMNSGNKLICELLTEIGETHHIDRMVYDTEENEMKPMPYITEAVIDGASFSGSIDFCPQTTEVEKAVIYHALKLLRTVGGKSARGYGRIIVETDEELDDSAYMEALNNTDLEFIAEWVKSIL